MKVAGISHGKTMKIVTLVDCGQRDDEACFAAAMSATGESKSRLFDWYVYYFEDERGLIAEVTLCTD